MGLLKKHWIPIILFAAVVVFYFALRLPNLTLQPIFADEAIYIRWAQVMKAESTLRFLPLSDGKTPLFMWTMMPFLKVFEDPLFAGRILSVMSGLATLLGIFILAQKVFNIRTALIAGLLYVSVPYALFFNRLGLVDSMLSAFTIWIIFFAISLLKNPRFDWSMILGYLLGGALLVKTPAMFNLFVLPLSLIGFSFKEKRKLLFRLLIGWIVAIVIAMAIYNVLRLGPNFHMLSLRNSDYVFSLSELKGRPLDPFIPHLGDVLEWFNSLITIPIWVFMLVGLGFVILRQNRLGLVIIIWSLIPALIQIAILKTFTARYLLPSVIPLLLISAFGIDQLLGFFKSRLIYLVLPILVILPLFTDYLLITNPAIAPLPKNERRGYLEDWTAGYGFASIAQFLEDKKKLGPVVVGTEGHFGTLPDGLQIYLDKSGIPFVGQGATISAQLRDAAKNNTTYYIGNRNRVGDNLPRTKFIMKFEKVTPLGNFKQDAIVVYQVFP